ncbi:hypothetical protein [Streptomyces sp. NPDC049813]
MRTADNEGGLTCPRPGHMTAMKILIILIVVAVAVAWFMKSQKRR